MAIAVILLIRCRRRKGSNKRSGALLPLRWANDVRSDACTDEAQSIAQSTRSQSESTRCTNSSPEMDLKMDELVVGPGPEEDDVENSENELENIYATIDEFYVNREFIYSAGSSEAKYMPVTEL